MRRHKDQIRIRTDQDLTPQVNSGNQDEIVFLETPLVSSDISQSPAPQSPAAPQPSISEVRQPTEFSPQKRCSTRIRQRPKHLVDYEVLLYISVTLKTLYLHLANLYTWTKKYKKLKALARIVFPN
jgi:hypothetical protein